MLESLSLDGKTVVITGGGTGLGLAMVRALARAGASLAIGGRRPAPIEAAAAEVEALGSQAIPVITDVTDSAQTQALIDAAIARFGKIDVLINNAGAVRDNVREPIWDITDDDWRRIMDVNLSGAFYCSRAAARPMADQGHGKIINVASGFGMRGGRDIYIYCCSKAGMLGLTRVLAFSLARYGVTANSIVPGFVPTGDMGATTSQPAPFRRFPAHRQAGQARGFRPAGGIPGVQRVGLYDRGNDHRRRRRPGRRGDAHGPRAAGGAGGLGGRG